MLKTVVLVLAGGRRVCCSHAKSWVDLSLAQLRDEDEEEMVDSQ